MLKRLQSRIFLVMAGILFLTTLTNTYLVMKKINKTMQSNQEKNALNLLNTVTLNVENQYESLVYHKNRVLSSKQQELQHITEMAISNLQYVYEKYKNGELSEARAKNIAKETIKNMRYDDEVGYFWINDMSRPFPFMIMHPTRSELDGKILNDTSFNCAEGVNKNLFVAFVDVCAENGQGFVDYLWPKPTKNGLTKRQPKLSYVELFKEWNWVVGTGVYIDDVEEENNNRLTAIIKELRVTLSNVKIKGSGYISIFNGNYEFLVHPLYENISNKPINPDTKNSIIDELIESSKTPGIPLQYRWDKPEDPGNFKYEKHAYTNYFEPLDWYITITYYKSDIDKTVNVIRNFIFFISMGFLLIAFWVSYRFTKSVTNPLNEIVDASQKISKGEFDISFKKSSIQEIDILNRSLSDMGNKLNSLTQRIVEEKNQLKQSEQNFREYFDTLSNAINEKDYSHRVELKSKDDFLSKSLNEILSALYAAETETNNQDWVKTGQAELNKRISGELKLDELCKNAITYISKHINAQVGTIYLRDQEHDDFYLVGSYAFKQRKGLVNRFKPGEGLIGQSALEKERIIFRDVPEDYVHIESSLGNVTPKNIIVLPLVFEQKVKGVIEIGSIYEFTPIQISFLELVCDALAVAINVTIAKEQMDSLYHRTIEQSEELRVQQEELQSANEDLEHQADELKKSQAKLQEQQEELRASNEELEEKTELLENQKSEIQKSNKILIESRKEIEDKAKMLELATQYKSEFLANMSHELRTPLNSLLLLARMLADNDENNLNEDQVESAKSILNSGQNLLRLINDVLDLSKIEAKKMELSITPISISALVQNFEMEFKHLAREKNLDFIVKTNNNIPKTVLTDGHRLGQILRNLIGNSIKFTKTGSIKVEIDKVENSDRLNIDSSEKELLSFSVTDTGMGIPESKQKLIFDSFTQVDGSISRQYGGTGLGLTISKELAQLLHGQLVLSNSSSTGTTFTVYIPLKIKNIADQNKEQKPVEPIHKIETVVSTKLQEPDDNLTIVDKINESDKRTILIIEDDLKFGEILVKFFNKKGYNAIVAIDGETGMKYVLEYNPIAIILDIKLPGVDGWTVMDELKNNPKTRHIPVHIMSAHDYGNKGLQKGAVGVLKKPVSIEQLNGVMSKLEYIIHHDLKELLIVEDDKELRRSILKLMEANDIKATSVECGTEALDVLRQRNFDCMILDLGLPDISGFDLLDKIHEDPDIKQLPIIIYTGRELTKEQSERLGQYSSSIVLKNAASPERLLDETALFMHRVESQMPEKHQEMIRNASQKEMILEGKNVLVIDDDMRNAFALNKFLKKKGMNVTIANNGEKALDILNSQEKNPDLILTDIMMPGMNGYDTIRAIRNTEKLKNIPIIALTAKAMKSDREECLRAGANDYLSKPVDVPKLITMMRIWLYHSKVEQ